jgi:hypothetical protein
MGVAEQSYDLHVDLMIRRMSFREKIAYWNSGMLPVGLQYFGCSLPIRDAAVLGQ